MRKTKKTLKPLKVGETFTLPCGAKIEVLLAYRAASESSRKSLIQFKITADNSAIVNENEQSLSSVRLGFWGQNIPEMIEILKRAELIGKE